MHDRPTFFDLFECENFAVVGPRTTACHVVPCFTRLQIRIPEGPGTALARAVHIDAASSQIGIEKDAIAVGMFDQTVAVPDTPDESLAKLILVHIKRDS